MDEEHWQKLMKRMDAADKIADALLYGDEDEDMEDAAAGAQSENDAAAEMAELQKQLEQVEKDRIIRGEGARPAAEWKRKDFKYLLWYHKELQKLSTEEIRALFLIPAGVVNGVMYFKRGNVRNARRRRGNGGEPLRYLAYPQMRVVGAPTAYADARAIREEDEKLNAIWQNL